MEANREKHYAVIHTYGIAKASVHADLLGLYNTKELAENALPFWRSAREESKQQLEKVDQPALAQQRRRQSFDRLIVFGFYQDQIKSNSEIVKLFLKNNQN